MIRCAIEKEMIPSCRNILSKARQVVISVPWGKVRGIEVGPRDAPPVLMVHGWLDNCYSFVPLLTQLPLDKRYIAIDLPGHGHSDHIPNNYYTILNTIVEMEFIRIGLGVDKMSLIGHSLGGIISALYTSTYPEHIEETVMIDAVLPRAMKPEETVVNQLRRSIRDHTKPNSDQTEYLDMDQLIERLANSKFYQTIPTELCGLILERGSVETDTGVAQRYDKSLYNASLMYVTKEMNAEFVKNWKTPLIYIQAEPGLSTSMPDYSKSIEEGVKLCSSSANFSSVTVTGPHHVHLTNSAEVAEVILDFFKKQAIK